MALICDPAAAVRTIPPLTFPAGGISRLPVAEMRPRCAAQIVRGRCENQPDVPKLGKDFETVSAIQRYARLLVVGLRQHVSPAFSACGVLAALTSGGNSEQHQR